MQNIRSPLINKLMHKPEQTKLLEKIEVLNKKINTLTNSLNHSIKVNASAQSWAINTNHTVSEIPQFLQPQEGNSSELLEDNSSSFNSTAVPLCSDQPSHSKGKIEVIKSTVPKVTQLEQRFSFLKPGGHYEPENCKAQKKIALIVPFRCRGEHLLLFLQHMHPFLKSQQIDYTIFIIEQDGIGPFNRAMLMNVGFVEALKIQDFDCFIFHDIDLLPEDDRNIYSCPQQPRHMSVAVDVMEYKLPYTSIFGGVSAITREHFELLNGFSNMFWGWGGEDDDMSNRIRYHNLHISRYPSSIARYTMLTHKKETPSPNRYEVLKTGMKRYHTDGLNSLQYTLVLKKENLLYTWLLVQIDQPS